MDDSTKNPTVIELLKSWKFSPRIVGSSTNEWTGPWSHKLFSNLKSNGFFPTAFVCDNPEHEEHGKTCIAVTVFKQDENAKIEITHY